MGAENLRQGGHYPLEGALVLLGGLFHLVLGDALHPGHGHEVIIEVGNRVADDDLELFRLGEGALDHLHGLDALYVGLGRVVEDEAHPRDAVGDCRDVFFAAHQGQQLYAVLLILSHSLEPPCQSTCLSKL